MAYAFTVTEDDRIVSGKKHKFVTIAETGTSNTDEWTVTLGTRLWKLVSYKATKTAGAGATINPKLGNGTGWTADTQEDLGVNTSTAVHISDQTGLILSLTSSTILYGVSQVASGTDNAITTELVLVEGA